MTVTLPFRRIVFWTHLALGLVVAIIVLVMSVTGVLLTYEKQIVRWADGYRVTAPPNQRPLPLAALVARAAAAHSGPPVQTVTVRRTASAPVELGLGREGTVFVHPYTGEILGTGSARARGFFRSVTDWHRWLARRDEQRATGRAITGAANLGFFFIVVSGFYLWWPRTWTWTQFRHVLVFRRRLPSKARDFNWHHVIGFWSLVPLAVIVWSGVVISYPWASDLTYRVVGEAPPPRQAPGQAPKQRPGPPAPAATGRGEGAKASSGTPALDHLFTQAEATRPDWQSISLRLPIENGAAAVTVDSGTGAQPQKRGTLTLDAVSGEVRTWEGFDAQSRGRQWRTWLRFAHTGEWYGLGGQTVAGVVTLGSVVLVWTGVALSLRRCREWWRRRRSRPHRAGSAKAA